MRNVTRHTESPSGANDAEPESGFWPGFPPTVSQETRLPGVCSVIRASHSRVSPSTVANSLLTLATQWRRLSPVWSTDATPSIHWGKLSNRDHWSHAVVTSTFTSMDCSTVGMEYQLLLYSGIPERSRRGAQRTLGTDPGLAMIQTWSSSAPAGTSAAKPAALARPARR